MSQMFGWGMRLAGTGGQAGGGGSGAVGFLMSSRTVQAGFAAMNGSNGTTDLDSNTRSSHWNASGAAVNKLKLIYPGWWYSSNVSPAEQNAPNNFTITCAIEYPAGVFTPVTIGTIVAGTNTVSSEVTLSTPIPADTQFWVRTYVSVTAGQKWMLGYQINSNRGEACDRNTGIDKTTSGTITGTSNGCGPIAIVATNYSSGTPVSTRWAGFGDSSVEGATVSIQDINGNQGFVGHACTSNVPYMNIARGGAAAVATASAMTKRLDIMTLVGITDVVVGMGSNDVISNTGIAPSTVTTALQTIYSTITAAGFRVHACPLPPNVTTSLPSIYGVPGTTTASVWAAGNTSTRAIINQYIRTPNAAIFRFNDTSALVETSLDSGLFKTSADFTGGSANVRIPPPRPITIQVGSTTTSFNTDLIVGSGVTTNSLSAKLAAVYFTSGVLTGVARVISSNTLYGTVINTASAVASAPSAGDTAIIYEISLTTDGAHTTDTGHNSILALYYGGSWLWSDMLAQYIAGRNATA